MKMQTRRGVKAARNVTVAAAAVFGLVLGSTGTAGAVVDDQNRIVSDGHEV
ncbi:MAG: porin, partial [Acidobacteria bacterium]